MIKKRKLTKIAALMCAITLIASSLASCACSSNSTDNGEIGSGSISQPERVVALTKSIGQLWILSGGELVGITEDGLDMDGISEDVVSVGTISSPSEEAITSLNPNLVLLSAEFPAHQRIAESLSTLGIETKSIDINSFDDYDSCMKEFTTMTGRDDLYKTNCKDVKSNIDKILKSYGKESPDESSTYLCMRISPAKNKALKDDYFACDILNDFGLINIAGDNDNLDDLSLEAIVSANPDYIFVIYQGGEAEAEAVYTDLFTSQDAWTDLDAVRNNNTYLLPKDLFQYKPNNRWDEAYEYIYEIVK